jgi:methyl-accepting chemotaxis protein
VRDGRQSEKEVAVGGFEMPASQGLMMFLWQQQGDQFTGHDIHLLMIFGGVIAAALVLQAVGLVVAALVASTILKKAQAIADTAETKITPILTKTNALLEDLSPKIRSVSTNVEQIAYTVREKTDELGVTLSQLNVTIAEANLKTRAQVTKVDGLVSDALATTREVSQTVQEGIRVPVRQIAGIIAGVKAGLETLVAKSPFGKKDYESPYDL